MATLDFKVIPLVASQAGEFGYLFRLYYTVILQGVVTSILPVETLMIKIKIYQVIKALFHSKSSNQDFHKSGNQGTSEVKLLGAPFVIKHQSLEKCEIKCQGIIFMIKLPVASASTDGIEVTAPYTEWR